MANSKVEDGIIALLALNLYSYEKKCFNLRLVQFTIVKSSQITESYKSDICVCAAACVIYTPALSDYWISQLTYGKYLHRAVTRGSLWFFKKKKKRRWGGRIGEGAVSMETVPLQLSEAKVSLGSFPNRTSILSTVLARKVFCIHNTSLSQEERPIAAEQQMHLPLRICPFKEL